MRRFAFISRHVPTQRRHELAAEQGITLVHVGDVDAFRGDFAALRLWWDVLQSADGWRETGDRGWQEPPFEGCIVVHPAAALRACSRTPTVPQGVSPRRLSQSPSTSGGWPASASSMRVGKRWAVRSASSPRRRGGGWR